ncbi:MAG: DUF4097 family beta strand repeat-containing protein [Spirochaetia bacterium]
MKRTAILTPLIFAAALSFALGIGERGDFKYDGIREIEIVAATFAVDIQGTRSRSISLEVRNAPDNLQVLHSRSRDRLEIWVERKFSLLGRPHRGELVLFVPRDAELRIRTSTGKVNIRNITGDRLSVDTTTGHITLEEITAAMRVETSTGAVEILDSAGRFDIRSTTGRIELQRTTGDVVAESSTGRHSYREIIGDLVARSTTGRIEIDGMQGTLDLRTSTGAQDGRGIVLTGDSSFESSTGRITMDFDGRVEQLEFDLRSTTGSLRVGREESQRRLFLGGTGFTIRGKSSTGSQEYF